VKKSLMLGARLPAHLFFEGEEDDYDFDLDKALASPKAKPKLEQWAERTIASGLKTKNGELLGKLTAYKVSGEGDEAVYLDPVKAREAMTFVETEGKDLPAKITAAVQDATGRLEVQLTQATSKLAEKDKAISDERTLRHQQKVGYELRDELRDAGIKAGKLKLHERHLRDFITIEVDEKTGAESLLIVDDHGQPRYGKNGLMTLTEFINEYRDQDDISDDFDADVSGGSGQGPGDRLRLPGGKIDQSLPPQERLRQFRANQAKSARA